MKTGHYLQQYKILLGVFALFFLLMQPLFSSTSQNPVHQSNIGSLDSLAQDSIIADSILASPESYIFVNADRPNLLLDSLIEKITVSDNNFVKWIEYTNSLKKDEVKMDSPSKFTRPAWVLIVLLCLFVAFGVVRIFFYQIFVNIIVGFYNERVLQQINKEDSLLTSWPYIFLYIIFSLSLGLFVVFYQVVLFGFDVLTLPNFLQASSAVFALFVVKILLIRIISKIFEKERVAKEYISILYLMYFNLILFLLPLLVIVTFIPENYLPVTAFSFLIIALLLFLIGFVRAAWLLLRSNKFSIFYLILYLCALEIAPILILVKSLYN